METQLRLASQTATSMISSEEMENVRKIVKSLEDSGLLIKGITKTIESNPKSKGVDFLVCY